VPDNKNKSQLSYSAADDSWRKKGVIRSLEFLTGKRKLQKRYNEVIRENPPSHQIWARILAKLGVEVKYNVQRVKKWPNDRPLIVIANHPFGVVDGIILGYLIAQIRQDFKIVVNEVLCREELLNPYLLPIDFRDTKEALQTNIQTRKEALDMLKNNQVIGIFPAGGVSTAPKFWKKADDLEWKKFVVKLIQQSEAVVVPVYFHGQNSRMFQMASQISENLRLGLLLNEVNNKIGREIHVEIGHALSVEEIEQNTTKDSVLDYLRQKVYQLKKSA